MKPSPAVKFLAIIGAGWLLWLILALLFGFPGPFGVNS